MRRAVVICASTRAATGVYPDRTGPLIVTALRAWGFDVEDATDQVREMALAFLARWGPPARGGRSGGQ